MKLVRIVPWGVFTLKDRAKHMLIVLLMLADCLTDLLTLGVVQTIFAAPLIIKRRDEERVKRVAAMDEAARQIGEALKKAFGSGAEVLAEPVIDFDSVIRSKTSKDN